MAPILITKADGTREPFDEGKLHSSLFQAGASEETIREIVKSVESGLKEGMTTGEIYRHAFLLLKDTEKPVASRYSLKRAVLAFGPTGFPFESFIAEIFKARGYETSIRQMVKGVCATHEVDMLAKRSGECIAAEVKFHNDAGMKSDLKVALYVHARFLDIIDRARDKGVCEVDRGFLITNTKFTHEAIHYGECVGLSMISWTYPSPGNLHDLIEETKVHPLTALTSLSNQEKTRLLEGGTVLCKTLQTSPEIMRMVGIKDPKIKAALAESEILCQPGRGV